MVDCVESLSTLGMKSSSQSSNDTTLCSVVAWMKTAEKLLLKTEARQKIQGWNKIQWIKLSLFLTQSDSRILQTRTNILLTCPDASHSYCLHIVIIWCRESCNNIVIIWCRESCNNIVIIWCRESCNNIVIIWYRESSNNMQHFLRTWYLKAISILYMTPQR